MTDDAFNRSLRAFCLRQPFAPFLVELLSGIVLRVAHPEVLMMRGSVAVYVGPDKTQQLFDPTTVCRLFDPPPTTENPT